VSGKIAATFPLPRPAIDLSSFMAEKLRLNDWKVSLGTLPELDELGLLEELLLHAARVRAAQAATDVRASLRLERKTNETTSFVDSTCTRKRGHRGPWCRKAPVTLTVDFSELTRP
jgi:hypothetical protein